MLKQEMLVHIKKMVMLMGVDVDFQQKQDYLEADVQMINGKKYDRNN